MAKDKPPKVVTLNLSLAATGPVEPDFAEFVRDRATELAEELKRVGVTTHFSCGTVAEVKES